MKTKKLLIACTFLFTLFVHQSCKKIDTDISPSRTPEEITQKFFALPAGADSAVIRAANYLKQQNSISAFVPRFAVQEGYAVWSKATVTYRQQQANFTASDNDADTTLIIPLVIESENKISGYIEVVLDGDVAAYLNRAGSYKDYPYESNDAAVMTAKKYALQMMKTDRDVFGDSLFTITDPQLLAALHSGSGGRGDQVQLSKYGLAAQDCYIFPGTLGSCTCDDPSNCDWNDPCYGAAGCPDCAQQVCFMNDGAGGSGNGPGGSSGGGSGGPGGCRQILAANPLPCGSGGSGGWNPVPQVPPLPVETPDEHWISTKFKDSTNNPCVANVLATLFSIDNKLPKVIRNFFGQNPTFEMNLKMGYKDWELNGGVYSEPPPNGWTMPIPISNISAQQVYINSYFPHSTNLSLVATIVHEGLHAQFQAWFLQAANDTIMQRQLLDSFGYIFWDSNDNNINTIPYIINNGDTAQHRVIAERYLNNIADAIYEFSVAKNLGATWLYCKDLAWGGLQKSPAWIDLPQSDRNRILENTQREISPNATLYSPDYNYIINPNQLNAKGQPCN